MLRKQDNYYMGEYDPSKPVKSVASAWRPEPLRIISAVDLGKIEQGIAQPMRSLNNSLFQNKLQLHLQSQNRVQTWKNTISGQRQAREQRRKDSKLAEEQRKAAIDEGFQTDASARRQAAVERARKMKYLESDEVKAFHSHLSTLHVHEEREMQIKIKKERSHAESLIDKRIMSDAIERGKKEEELEAKKQLLSRLHRVQLAQVHLQQAKERRLHEYQEKQNLFEYGQKLAADDQKYKEETKTLAQIKRKKEADRKAILENMKVEHSEMKRMAKIEAEEEERMTIAWAEHQDYKQKVKQRVEEEWRLQKLKIRNDIGTNNQKMAVGATEREREIIDRQQMEFEKKRQEEADRKVQKKLETFQELKKFQELYQASKVAAKAQAIKDGQDMLEQYKNEAKARNAENAIKKEKMKAKEEALTLHNKSMAMEKEKEKVKTRRDELKDTEMQTQQDLIRKKQLIEYMQSVTKESWAEKNPKIQMYVQNQVSEETVEQKRRTSSFSTQYRDSHARVGFSGHKYAPIDLLGSNEICNGQVGFGIDGAFKQTKLAIIKP